MDDCPISFDLSLGNGDSNWKILSFHLYCDISIIVILRRNLPNTPNITTLFRKRYNILSILCVCVLQARDGGCNVDI